MVTRSVSRFRLLVEGVTEYAIFQLDLEGRVTTWNAGAERIKGYAAAQIIGRPFAVFYTPDDAAAGKPMKELKLAAEQGQCEDEGWRVRADGTRFWANVVITALRDDVGNLRGFAKLTRDITDRKRTEDTLKKQASLLDLAHDSIFVRDLDSTVTYWNQGAATHYGWTSDEAVGQVTHELLKCKSSCSAKLSGLSSGGKL